jgi:hypothetical protein
MKLARRMYALLLCMVLLCAMLLPVAADTENGSGAQILDVSACETLDGWTADGDLALDTEDQTQGEACVSITFDAAKDSNVILSAQVNFDPIDISGFGTLEFDFYISDPTLLMYSQIVALDFGSSKDTTSERISWYEDALAGIDKSGWYHITLPVDAATTDGFDTKKLSNFVLQFFHVNPPEDLNDVVIKIDNITATIPEYQKVSVDTCDTVDGWAPEAGNTVLPSLDSTVKKQGTGSVRLEAKLPEYCHFVFRKQYAPIDATAAAYLEMDIYISDLGVFENANYPIAFEITSSGQCDQQEYEWSLEQYITKVGWNHVRLPILEGRETNGAPNMSAINYIRFHTLSISKIKGEVFVFRVDNIYFSTPVQTGTLGATPIIREDDTPDTPDTPNTPDAPTGPDVPDGDQPENGTQNNNSSDSALRARKTEQRAKILLLLMVFVIIGIDVVVVALRRRNEQDAVLVTDGSDGQPPCGES